MSRAAGRGSEVPEDEEEGEDLEPWSLWEEGLGEDL